MADSAIIPQMEGSDVSAIESPRLTLTVALAGVRIWTDPSLAKIGTVVAFTERAGGASRPPYHGLNLAAHVGDDPADVDSNRTRLCEALGIGDARERLVTAEQVHGVGIAEVGDHDAGSGAFASGGRPPIASTDALLTASARVPLLMLYADCVPVVIVAQRPRRAVCVVHAGWRGALAGLPGAAATRLAEKTGCVPSELWAYLGPHIGGCCYEVGEDTLSEARAAGAAGGISGRRLDLGRVVREDLARAGLIDERVVEAGMCTRDNSERFFSYRRSSVTGRHGALAMLVSEQGR
ncbi:MAG TPA: polyphenol oxidase family protein [Coriobacteriia bacterium]|nr:polyphenol oxidase family protein [Coriobacteriia bacterium]